tara:strand:+ start:541 stop:735 length:195 start_codon:yes stop_codon:yes gene_type:complete
MYILVVISVCLVLFFIFKQFQTYLDKIEHKTNIIEAAIFYLFFFRLISIALMIGFVLYWLAGAF